MPDNDEDARRRAARERAAAERKETEDLLAGFDRPGRTPRPPAALRDFVEFHGERRGRRPEPGDPAAAAGHVPARADVAPERLGKPAQKDIATFVLPERGPRHRWLLAALLLVVAMPLFGGGVAYCLLVPPEAPAAPARSAPPPKSVLSSSITTAPVTATSSSSSSSSPLTLTPESASAPERAPPTSARPRAAPTASAPRPTSSDPRVDFIRNL